MKEIARLAVAQGFTQESLARKWGDGIRGGNIQRHFEAKKPREDTLRRYADILGVKPEYLLLLHSHTFEDAATRAAHAPDPAGASERYWLDMLALGFQSDEWQTGTDRVVREYLLSLPVIERRRYLESFALVWYREEYLGEPILSGRRAHDAFVVNAPPNLELQNRRQLPLQKRFLNLWGELNEVLNLDEFDLVLALLREVHVKRGIDVAPMDTALNDDVLYRKWREERQQGKP
jgi:hypothetical protein